MTQAIELLGRIEERQAALGLRDRDVDRISGRRDTIKNIRAKARQNLDYSPRSDVLNDLARALQTTPSWLLGSAGATESGDMPGAHLADEDMAYERGHPQGLQIKGSVAAGAWFEIDPHSDNGDLEFAPVVPSPQYPASAQYALRVRGDSINKIATEGDLLRCLDLGITGLEPRDGDLVIVEQVRDDGLLHEVTAKRVVRANGVIQLEPESTNPRWKPIVYDPARDDGSIEVRIIAIVDTVIRPVFRGRS